jgi:hypothetical protein
MASYVPPALWQNAIINRILHQQGATRVLLTDFIQAIPKIELHALRAGIQSRTLLALAQRNGGAAGRRRYALREQYASRTSPTSCALTC